jgi:dihydroorotate dehydrogenase
LLCSLEDDGDTLWAVCDLGLGYVEYGTVSLKELETGRGPRFKMPFERDRHFDGRGFNMAEALGKTSLVA